MSRKLKLYRSWIGDIYRRKAYTKTFPLEQSNPLLNRVKSITSQQCPKSIHTDLLQRYNLLSNLWVNMPSKLTFSIKFNKKWSALVNYSHINNLEDVKLYRGVCGGLTSPIGITTLSLVAKTRIQSVCIYGRKGRGANVGNICTHLSEYLHRFNRKRQHSV